MTAETRLRDLIDAAQLAYEARVTDERAQKSIGRIFEALAVDAPVRARPGNRLPACAHLTEVLEDEQVPAGPIRDLISCFHAAEPYLEWYKRTGDTTNCNDAYWDGHANAMIAGPGGAIESKRAWLGVSLLAPGVRYPDHTHPPEETYLVLSDGEFSHGDSAWFTPGMGGTFYNPPGIVHAMRSGHAPLFAMWALWASN